MTTQWLQILLHDIIASWRKKRVLLRQDLKKLHPLKTDNTKTTQRQSLYHIYILLWCDKYIIYKLQCSVENKQKLISYYITIHKYKFTLEKTTLPPNDLSRLAVHLAFLLRATSVLIGHWNRKKKVPVNTNLYPYIINGRFHTRKPTNRLR